MKKLPLLICCVLGLILLPWHFILPEGEAPHPEASELPPSTLVKYREELVAKGVQDPRLDDFVILELGRKIVADQRAEEWRKNDPQLMMRYENVEWANRRPSYFVRLLTNIYGNSSASLLKSKAWIVPSLLLLLFGFLHSTMFVLRRAEKKEPNQAPEPTAPSGRGSS
jgi:hypothetical protein